MEATEPRRVAPRVAGVLAWVALVAGCGAAPAGSPDSATAEASSEAGTDASAEGGDDDPDPVFTPAERAALRALRYDSTATPPPDPSDHVADDPRARALGQRLFFDPGFSGRLLEGDNDGSPATLGRMGDAGRVSCAGCHVPTDGFVDTRSPHRQISLAAQWTARRTPTVLEVAFAPLYNWDGRRDSIWGQALGVMESDHEFNSGRLFVAEQVFRRYRAEYEALFGAMPALDAAPFAQLTGETAGCQLVGGVPGACRGKPGDHGDYDGLSADQQRDVTRVAVNAAKAIEAYVRLLRCGASRFDAWLDGDMTQLTRAEQRGAALFVGRGRCVPCHGGPRLTDGAFHNVGLVPRTVAVAFVDRDDRGALAGITAALSDPLNTRGEFSDGDRAALPASVAPALEGAFRTPTLRCGAGHPSFMHTAQFRTLDEVVAFFDRGGDAPGGYPGTSEIAPLGLTARERSDLVAFLATLQGPGPDASLLRAPP